MRILISVRTVAKINYDFFSQFNDPTQRSTEAGKKL